MRKTIVTALIALSVMLALASCDSPMNAKSGDGLVTLNVNAPTLNANTPTDETAGKARSLTNTLAKAEANLVEVIFRKEQSTPGTYKYYRAAGRRSSADPLLITIPVGDYKIEDALILLGRNVDKTLLATGIVSAVDSTAVASTAGTTFTIAADTSSITFTVTELAADISPTASSAFKIDLSSISGSGFEGTGTGTGKTIGKSEDGFSFFQVPTSKANIKASLVISNLSATAGNIIYAGGGAVSFTPALSAAPTLNNPVTGASLKAVNSGTSNYAEGEIAFTFTTGSVTDTEHKVKFDIPVYGYVSTVPAAGTAAITWHIRAGTQDKMDFDGTGGEGVALLVKDDPDKYATLEINTSGL